MINLRYHIVSLVAVFLALAVGVIAGTTVINDQIVEQLHKQQAQLLSNRAALEAENDGLEHELDLWESYGRAQEAVAIKGMLTGRSVLLVEKAGVPGDLIGELQDLIIAAGGQPAGRITFTAKWALQEETAREQLALALGEPQPDEVEKLLSDAAAALAARLRSAADPGSDADLLNQLQRADFLAMHDIRPGQFPARNTMVLALSPGIADSQPVDRTFMLPFLRGLTGSVGAVVAEPLDAQQSLADGVRADADLRRAIATVDHVNTIPGQISLVVGLHDVSFGLEARHFGTRSKTQGVAPSPSP
jgi:hypothetical protein